MCDRKERYDALEGTQKRGQATEAVLKAEFLVRGVPALVPEYDSEPYDFAIELADQFYKLQAKTAYESTEGTVRFETVSTCVRSDGTTGGITLATSTISRSTIHYSTRSTSLV